MACWHFTHCTWLIDASYVRCTTPYALHSRAPSSRQATLLDASLTLFLLQINTNGILTFNVEFPEYLNQPFPLEYPSIAAFYSNVDTTNSNDDSSISLFQTTDPASLQRAQQLVQYAYSEEQDFEVQQLVVATWRNVGYFNSKTDRLNTFQVALIANEQRTFVHFIYPEGGLNWLQGEVGELGLPDIRAQVGFVAEDGRYYNLNGSGSENVSN